MGRKPRSRITRRQLLSAAAGIALTGAAAGCTSGAIPQAGRLQFGRADYAGPKVELRFWSGLTGADGPVVQQIVNRFMKQHPNIGISTYVLPWDELNQKLPAAVASGLAPDIGLLQDSHLAENAARQVIVPLDSLTNL